MLGFEALGMALRSLWNRKMRSILTILGVVIGIGSVIAVVSLGAAFEESITSQFDEIDDRSIFVTCGATGVQNGPPDCGQFGLVFTEVDRQGLLALDGVERVIASGATPITNLRYEARDVQFQTLYATTEDADEVRLVNSDPDKYLVGGPFEDGSEQMVVGYAIAQQLSGVDDGDPTLAVGDDVVVTLIDGSKKTVSVAGVLAKDESLFGEFNGQVFVPLDPFYTITRDSPSTRDSVRVFGGFTVIGASNADITDVQDRVAAYMENRSDAGTLLAELEDLEVFVATASDIQDQIGTAFDQVTIFIAAIAATSLVVGGIMIGTIMLITVTERTKEIGVMKAIGGLNRDILWMFLLEAAIIGLVGSLIGIGLGIAGGATLIGTLFGGEGVSFVMPWDWIAISVAVGVLTGVVAGFLPARRATKIQPVEALSYE